MPVWLLALLPKVYDALISLALKYALPVVVQHLQNSGFTGAAEAIALKGAAAIVKDVRAIKTYPEYPSGKNDPFNQNPPPPPAQNNLNQG